MSHKHLTITSDLRQLKSVRDAVLEVAEPCLHRHAHWVVLAVDEAVSNVMRHSHEGSTDPLQPGGGAIDVDIDSDGLRVEVLIADHGPAFDPCAAEFADAPERVHARQRGGMGLSIMRRVMDEISYDRTPDQRNRLRLVKFIDPAT